MEALFNEIFKAIATVVAEILMRFFLGWLVCAGVAYYLLMTAGFAGMSLWFLSVIAGTVVWFAVLFLYEALTKGRPV